MNWPIALVTQLRQSITANYRHVLGFANDSITNV